MEIKSNSRQIPYEKAIVSDKNYSDLLYTWLQCNSERVNVLNGEDKQRKIEKKKCKWQTLENSMTRVDCEGKVIKLMERRTIKKYFLGLIDLGLIQDKGDEYYYITILPNDSASLLEFNTLSKLLNVFQQHSITLYSYLFNRFYAAGQQSYEPTIAQIKEVLGFSNNTFSNNIIITDTLDILKQLGVLDYKYRVDEINKKHIVILWVKNSL